MDLDPWKRPEVFIKEKPGVSTEFDN